jgi:DNA-binding beta-propeller fold protein YncE
MESDHVSSLASIVGAIAAVLPFVAFGCSDEDAPPPNAEACGTKPGTICTIVGDGMAGYLGDGGPALKASLYFPFGIEVDRDGTIYIVDSNNHAIRFVSTEGIIDTLAGAHTIGDGPPGPAKESALERPTQVRLDGRGGLLIAAWHNHRVKRVHLASRELENLCGIGEAGYSGDGGPCDQARLHSPVSVAVDPAGTLWVLDQENQIVRAVDAEGVITRRAGRCFFGPCASSSTISACPGAESFTCWDPNLPGGCDDVCRPGLAGDGASALEARFAQPAGLGSQPGGRLALEPDGSVIVSDPGNHRLRRIRSDGRIETVGTIDAPVFLQPTDLVVSPNGTIYVADSGASCIRMLGPAGEIAVAAGVCGSNGSSGDGGPATEALLHAPHGLALDHEGNLYIADTRNHRIRRVTAQ